MTIRGVQREYLNEILMGEYASHSEDRLTQVLAATFNASQQFRHIFMSFAGIKVQRRHSLRAQTQTEYDLSGKYARTDMEVRVGSRVVLVVENKVESRLTAHQLLTYNKIPDVRRAKKVALVKHYFPNPKGADEWRVLHWHDLHAQAQKALSKKCHEVDRFVIRGFVSRLEVAQMDRATFISSADLKIMARALHKVQYDNRCWLSLKKPVFQTAQNFLDILEGIIDESRTRGSFVAKVGGRYLFNPAISSSGNARDREKRWPISLQADIKLKKPINEIVRLGLGLFMTERGTFDIVVYAINKKNRYIQRLFLRSKSVEFTTLCSATLSVWQKWLR